MSQEKRPLTGAEDELLTVPQVAEITKRCHKTIRNWIYRGDLPAQKIGKYGRFRIKRSDLDAALTYTPTSPSNNAE